jgi:alpha-maltose-1-phosphate synthase
VHPDYPDPFSMFRAHPTSHLGDRDRVGLADVDARFVLARLRKNALHMFAALSLLDQAAIDRLLARLESSSQTVAEITASFSPAERPKLLRTIVWLYKYGIVSVTRAPD